ncbi:MULTISPECIES: hypothetical protein [unclassified Rhizobium]|uniref:hypothetical protein n=1 Tax=Rhizobium TaxID=379 RepID=UPI00084C7DA6|nr:MULTISPECIES: hypothetical protein [unclassified Rhizobium]OEC95548.1 hypothetical protein A9Z06_30750 [Rhizobium sp. YK2]QYA15162.1 hypothetical protein J5284_25365 [Rhizobium sp. AB2/73]UEQ83971.1 hypothetical protein I8E17_21785 [Rhizobium sp. AB2/73]
MNGARLAGGHLNDGSQKGRVDNLSRRPGDGRIIGSGFSGEMLAANDPGGNVSSLGSGPFWQIL